MSTVAIQLNECATRTSASRTSSVGARADLAIRALDLAIVLPLLLFCAPLMVGVAIVIWVSDGGPPLFGHTRIGRGGRSFKCLKFRSMVRDSEARLKALLETDSQARAEWERDHKLRKDPRITPFGLFLRRSSLDELPQFLNVVRGEMSLVGPRPIVAGEVPRYGRRLQHYMAVNPGVTGLWQVSGRNDVGYRRRVAMDVLYVKTLSPARYLQILFATVPAVLSRRGAS